MYKQQDENAEARRRLARTPHGRGGRLCGSTYLTRWMHNAAPTGHTPNDLEGRLARLARDLDSGGCLGVGEIGPLDFVKKPGQAVIAFPLNFPPLLRVARLAAAKGVWLDLHAEPVSADGQSHYVTLFGGIALLYRLNPQLKLILSHTGMTNSNNARALLETYPNLLMNLKIVLPGRALHWEHLEPITNGAGELYEDWAALMEEFPRRFMIGSDARFGTRKYRGNRYSKRIKSLRRLLGSLNPEAAALIAHGNAHRVFPQ